MAFRGRALSRRGDSAPQPLWFTNVLHHSVPQAAGFSGFTGLPAHRVLGIDSKSDVEDVKKAYRKLLFQTHPDHGGDSASFLRVKQAFDTLMARHDPSRARRADGMVSEDSLAKTFREAVNGGDETTAWEIWGIFLSSSDKDERVSKDVMELYLQLCGQTQAGYIVALDALFQLRDSGTFGSHPDIVPEDEAYNMLLWHIAQTPETWGRMDDVLNVLARMDELHIQPDLALLESQLFTFFPRK